MKRRSERIKVAKSTQENLEARFGQDARMNLTPEHAGQIVQVSESNEVKYRGRWYVRVRTVDHSDGSETVCWSRRSWTTRK